MRDDSSSDYLHGFVLRFLDQVRLQMAPRRQRFGNSDINKFLDKLRSDGADSGHRAIYSFCWRHLFLYRSGGLHRIR